MIELSVDKTYTPEEVAENRRRWLEALRSGEYRQGTGTLETSDGKFCCLGVACNVLGAVRGVTPEGDIMYDNTGGFLPPTVQRALGLSTHSPMVEYGVGSVSTLVYLNDGHRKSFDEIADIIEAQAPEWDGGDIW